MRDNILHFKDARRFAGYCRDLMLSWHDTEIICKVFIIFKGNIHESLKNIINILHYFK